MSSQQPEKENPKQISTKSGTEENKETLLNKLGKRYTNLKQVIQADQLPADSDGLNQNPFEGFRSGLMLKPPKKRVDQEVLTELGKLEEQRLNQLSENYLQKINGYLEKDVSDARSWACPEAEPGDWDNVPEIAVQIIDYLAKHGKVVADQLSKLSQEETTAQLRFFTEQKLKETENELQAHKISGSNRLDELKQTNQDQFAQFLEFQNDALSLRKNYLQDQPNQRLESFLGCRSGMKDTELVDDNTSDEDVLQAKISNEPRMFTLEQLIQFFNVKIAKSKLRKELTANNADTKELLRRVSALETWRVKFESQTATDLDVIGRRFNENENTHKEFKAFSEAKFKKSKIHLEAFEKHKQKISDELSRLSFKNIDQDNLIEGLNKQQILSLSMLTNKIEENQNATVNRFKSVDDFILLQFTKTNKDFDRLKQDCFGMIDRQTDRMNSVIATDLQNVRQTYDKAVDGLDEVFAKLNKLFKEKIFKMKSKVAEIFAQSEIRFNQLNEEIRGLSKMLQVWQTTQKNPVVSFDAKIFSLQVKQDEMEKDNKTQQFQIKDVLDKLLLTLQSKDEPDPRNTNHPNRSDFNFPRNTSQKEANQLAIKIFDGVGLLDQSSDILPSLGSTKHIFNQTHDSLQLQSDEGADAGVKFNYETKFVRKLESLRQRLNQDQTTLTETFTNSTLKTSKFLQLPSTTMLKSDSNFKVDEKNSNSQLLSKQLQMLSPRSPIQLNTQSNMNLGSMLANEQPTFSQKQSSLQLFKATGYQPQKSHETASKPSSVLKEKILESEKQINNFDSFIKRQQNSFQEKLKRRSQSIRPVMRSEIKEEPLVYQ